MALPSTEIPGMLALIDELHTQMFKSAPYPFGEPDRSTASGAIGERTITAEKIQRAMRQAREGIEPFQRRAANIIALSYLPPSMEIVIGADPWPQEQAGVETAYLRAHPLVCWLARFLPITPSVAYVRPKMVDKGPFLIDGRTHMSVRQYAALKAAKG